MLDEQKCFADQVVELAPVAAQGSGFFAISTQQLRELALAGSVRELVDIRARQLDVAVEAVLDGVHSDVAQWVRRGAMNASAKPIEVRLAELAQVLRLYDATKPSELEGLSMLCSAAHVPERYALVVAGQLDGAAHPAEPKPKTKVTDIRRIVKEQASPEQIDALLKCSSFHELIETRLEQIGLDVMQASIAMGKSVNYLGIQCYKSKHHDGPVFSDRYGGASRILPRLTVALGLEDARVVKHLCDVAGSPPELHEKIHQNALEMLRQGVENVAR